MTVHPKIGCHRNWQRHSAVVGMIENRGVSKELYRVNKDALVLVLRLQKCVIFGQFPKLFVVPNSAFNDIQQKGYFACGKILVGL